MFAVLVALLSLTETCPLEYRPNDWGPAVYADCESPGAQAAADAALVGLSLPRLFQYEDGRPNRLSVVRDGETWRAEPLILAMEPLSFPLRPIERGAYSARCVYGGVVQEDGRLDGLEIVCDVDNEDARLDRYARDYERAVRESLRTARVAAAPGTCMHTEIDWSMNDWELDEANIDLPDSSTLCP